MSSSEEDVDYAPTKDFSDDGSEGSSESLDDDSQLSGGSESEAEFTDDEENSKSKPKKRSKVAKPSKNKKEKRSRFLDTEALVGDETEDDDEEDAEFLEDFIAGSDEEEEAAAAAAEIRETRPRKPVKDYDEEFDAEAEEQRLKALYGRHREISKPSASATSNVPRPFLLPTVTDPKLWLCKAQQGRERSSALALLRVVMERQYSGQPLQIFSIIARDGLKGYVYIEAHKPIHIAQAIEVAKLNHCLYPGQAGKSLVLVPLAEMPQVLQTTAASGASGSAAASAEIPDIASWVRVKRGRYASDLAQVVDNAQDEGSYDPTNLNTCIIRVKLLPRLNFTASSSNNKDRAPPRVFDPEEASKYGPVSKSRGFWIFGGETYRDGFLFKNIRLSSLITGAVSPTPEELARFPDSDRSTSDDFSGSSESIGSQEISLSPGDQVIVLEGEMKNLQAAVDSLEWRPNPSNGRPEQFAHLLADASTGLQGESARFTIKVSQLRKIFAVGAQVRIVSGPHANEIGIVVAIDPNTKNVVIFASGSNQQFSVPAGICALAQANASGNLMEAVKQTSAKQSRNVARSNDYSLDDLVQFEVEIGGEEGVGIVIRILDTENSVAVYDSLGQIRNIPCRSVRLVANYNENSGNSFAAAASGDSNLKQGDRVIEKNSGAFYKVLHIYKSMTFVKPLSGAIPSGTAAIAVLPLDTISKPRPVPAFRPQGSSVPGGPSPTGHMLGKSVTITGGPQKGYVGFVKQIADNIARVELHTNGKIISVSVDKLALVSNGKNKDTRDSRDSRDSSASSARTPAWNSSSAKTPAWNASGAKTPGWNASGAKTPGWNAPSSSRTPGWNPAASSSSSRTPAWNAASSARTPAWNPSTSGAKTPAWSTSTGMTPAWNVPTAVGQSSTAANWQKGTTPAWNSSSARTPAWSRPDEPTADAEQKDNKDKQPWDQVNNWKKD